MAFVLGMKQSCALAWWDRASRPLETWARTVAKVYWAGISIRGVIGEPFLLNL